MKSNEIADLLRPLLDALAAKLASENRGVPGRPEPREFTTQENGMWLSWAEAHSEGGVLPKNIHSIRFEDGTVFDMRNGWRPPMTPMPSDQRASEAGEAALRRLASQHNQKE